MSDYIQNNQQIDGRAAAALAVDAGLDRDEAQHLTAILREAGVLRSAIGIRSIEVHEKLDKEPYIELEFESGRKLAGKLSNDISGPMLAWSNPLAGGTP